MINREQLEALRLEYRKARSTNAKNEVLAKCAKLCDDNPEEFADILEAMISDSTDKMRAKRYKQELEPLNKILKMNYIITHYLHKSNGWFTQRLNGMIVSGNPVYFKQQDLDDIESAIHDVGKTLLNFKFNK